MIKFIIFSKDRPAQLDRLLNSIHKHYQGCKYTVIYAGNQDNLKLYFRSLYVNSDRMRLQKNFKTDVLEEMTEDNVCFLVDDMQFIDDFRAAGCEYYEFQRNEDILCLSLRLHPGINYSYTKGHDINVPNLQDLNGCKAWHWKGRESYWGYPMSLDGHIFRTKDIKPIIERLDFNNPNELEGQLALNPIKKDLMICYEMAKVVNFPLNVVQDVCENRSMGIELEYLNDSFKAGHRMALQYPDNYFNSCHVELQPEWI